MDMINKFFSTVSDFLFKSELGALVLAGLFILFIFVVLFRMAKGKKHAGSHDADHGHGGGHGHGHSHWVMPWSDDHFQWPWDLDVVVTALFWYVGIYVCWVFVTWDLVAYYIGKNCTSDSGYMFSRFLYAPGMWIWMACLVLYLCTMQSHSSLWKLPKAIAFIYLFLGGFALVWYLSSGYYFQMLFESPLSQWLFPPEYRGMCHAVTFP